MLHDKNHSVQEKPFLMPFLINYSRKTKINQIKLFAQALLRTYRAIITALHLLFLIRYSTISVQGIGRQYVTTTDIFIIISTHPVKPLMKHRFPYTLMVKHTSPIAHDTSIRDHSSSSTLFCLKRFSLTL